MSQSVAAPVTTPAPAAPVADPAAAPVVAPVEAAPPAIETNILADAPAAEVVPPVEEVKVETPAERKPEELLAALKMPEGITATDPLVVSFLDAASKANVSDEVAQALVDKLGPEFLKQTMAPYELWKGLQTEWQAKIKADPDIGGDKLPAAVQTINKAFALIGGEALHNEVREALNTTGAGNNPAIIKMFHKLASRLTEGGGPVTGKPPAERKSGAALLYPSSPAAAG